MAKKTYRVIGAHALVLKKVEHPVGDEFQEDLEPEHEEFYLSTGQLELVEKPKKDKEG